MEHDTYSSEYQQRDIISVCEDIKITAKSANDTIDTRIRQTIKKPKVGINLEYGDDKSYVNVIELYDDYHRDVINCIDEIVERIKNETIIALKGKRDTEAGELMRIFSNIKGYIVVRL